VDHRPRLTICGAADLTGFVKLEGDWYNWQLQQVDKSIRINQIHAALRLGKTGMRVAVVSANAAACSAVDQQNDG
jgi:hypothetical protein